MFLSTLIRRLESLPDRENVLREAVRQLQDWLGVESSVLRPGERGAQALTPSHLTITESVHNWSCRIRVAEHELEFRHPSAPLLSPSDIEGLEGFAGFLEELLNSRELSTELFDLEEQVQGLIDTSLHLLATLEPDGRVCHRHAREIHTPLGLYLWQVDWLKPEFREEVQRAVARVREEGVSSTLQVETSRSASYELTLHPLSKDTGEVSSLIAQGRDVSDRHRMREVLLEEREFLRAVLESIDEAIIVCDLKGKISLVNASASRRFGLKRGDSAAKNLPFLNAEEGALLALEFTPLGRILAGEKLREAPAICRDQDGDTRLMVASGCRLYDSEGQAYGAVVALHDTTRRRRAENALAQSERQFRALFHSQPSAILSLDSEGIIQRCNPAVRTVLGFSPEELQGRQVTALFDSSLELDLHFPGERELQLKRSDGRVSWGLATTVPVRDAEGDLGVMWSITDISKQKKAQAELDVSNRKLAESREMERSRLARELHDDAVQNLLAVSYRLPDPELRKEVVGVVQQLRELISDLRPPGLREFGLEAAIEGLLAKLKRNAGEKCPDLLLKCRALENLPESVSICLFRVVQESVTNIIRHAEAERSSVFITGSETEVRLEVSDDGKGFDVPSNFDELASQDSFGLAGIKERVDLVKGDFSLYSHKGQGTRLEVAIPV